MTGEKVEMLYDGKRYPMNIAETPEVQSRYYAPRFFGLQLEKAYDFRTSKYLPWRLYWGEFDRAVNASYTFALQFADRDCQPLNFELKIKNDHHGGVEEILLVDGKTVDASAVYKVVLP